MDNRLRYLRPDLAQNALCTHQSCRSNGFQQMLRDECIHRWYAP